MEQDLKEFFLNWKIEDADFKNALRELLDDWASEERHTGFLDGYDVGRYEGYEEGYEDGRQETE